jgi:chaperonin cofactor prefoldin
MDNRDTVQIEWHKSRIRQLAKRAAKRGRATENELKEIEKAKEEIKKLKMT